jgi:hypothetical protein
LQRLERLKARWLKLGWTTGNGVGELFAEAHAAAGDVSGAIRWYDAVLASTTGDCSIRAYEQRSNLRVRDAWAKVDAARQQAAGATEGRGRGTAREAARQRALAAKALRQAIAKARRIIRAEDRSLASLRMFGETAERTSLRGAAMKRLAMVEAAAKSPRGERRAIAEMKKRYEAAAEQAGSADLFNSVANIIVAQLALGERVDQELFTKARKSLAKKETEGPDFWSIAEHTNLELYEAVAARQLARRKGRIVSGYTDLARRVGAGTKWASVYSTAAFVLAKYAQHGKSKQEADAAQAILEALQKLIKTPARS